MRLVKHTQQAILLSINTITRNRDGVKFSTIPLLQLTPLIFLIWSICQFSIRQTVLIQNGYRLFLSYCEMFYVIVQLLIKAIL